MFKPGEDPTLFDQKVSSLRYPDSVALYSGSAYQRYSRRTKRHVGRAVRKARRSLPV